MPGEGQLNAALRPITVTRIAGSRADAHPDVAAVEEPLEIRLNGAPFVVIMRTPGHDRDLTAGFLYSERIIAAADDLDVVRHCTDPNGGVATNVISVRLSAEASARGDALIAGRRSTPVASACGVCGRRTIAELMAGVAPVAATWRVSPGVIDSLPDALRARQAAFRETGGLHAAALFNRDGALVASAEDIGRHNAVDKVVGRQLLAEKLVFDEMILMVSGRAGYEIVQKSLVAGIPVLASVSAPTSLAIQLAQEGGLTLLGFVRDGSFNVYAGAERIDVP